MNADVWPAVVGALVISASAAGQSAEYRLDESRRWTEAAGPEAGTDADLIAQARRLLAEDKPASAKKLLDPWIEANRRAGSPYLPEALLLRGDSLVAMDREFTALYDYEEVCKKHRESEVFADAVERELEIALRYAHGLKMRVFGVRWGDPEAVLVELLLRVNERLPRSQAAERAMIELADYYYRRRELAQAKDVYDAYVRTFPSGPNARHAAERRILCDVARFKGPRYNAAALIDAKVQVEQFERRYPFEADAKGINQSLVARLDESMAAQLLDTAEWYLKVGDEPSARVMLRRLVRDHPRTRSAAAAERIMVEREWMPGPSAETGGVEAEPAEAEGADSEDGG